MGVAYFAVIQRSLVALDFVKFFFFDVVSLIHCRIETSVCRLKILQNYRDIKNN